MPEKYNVMKDVDKFASRLSEMDKRIKKLEYLLMQSEEQKKNTNDSWSDDFDEKFVYNDSKRKSWKNTFRLRPDETEELKNFIRQTIQKRDDEIIKWAEDRRGECGIDTKGCEYCEALKQIINFIESK